MFIDWARKGKTVNSVLSSSHVPSQFDFQYLWKQNSTHSQVGVNSKKTQRRTKEELKEEKGVREVDGKEREMRIKRDVKLHLLRSGPQVGI